MTILRATYLLLLVLCCSVPAYATTFTDQASFSAALAGLSASHDNFEAYSLGTMANGQTAGAFSYSFDPAVSQPGIASDGNGGQALGDTTFGVGLNDGSGAFVGGESVILTHLGANPLIAFGADFSYAPAFDALPGALYQLLIRDGNGAGTIAVNLPGLDPSGGTFFLGFIGDPFTTISLQSLATDADGNPFLTPAYQVDNLIYASATSAPVPEPGTLLLLAIGTASLMLCTRIRARLLG
jgi:hypothetical protein